MIVLWAAVLGVVSEELPSGRQGIAPLAEHEYAVRIEQSGEHRILLTHTGADIVLEVSSDHSTTLRADIPNRLLGEEYVVVLGAADYKVKVVNRGGDHDDFYELSVVPIPKPQLTAARLSSVATTFSGAAEAKQELLARAIAAWAPHDMPVEKSRLEYALGAHYRSIDELEEAAAIFARAAEIEAAAGLQNRSLWSRYAAAEMRTWLNELEAARAAFDSLAREAEELGDIELVGASRNYAALGYLIQGDLERARSLYLELAEFLDAHDLHHQLATVYHNLGGTHFESGEPLDALHYFERAMALDRKTNPDASVAETLEEIGGLYALMGRCDVAFRHLNQALLEMRGETVGAETGSGKRAEGRIVNRIGNCHRDLGDFGLALDFYARALALRTEAADERGAAYTLENIGEVYRERGQFQRAREMHRRSLNSHMSRGDALGETSSLIGLGNDQLALHDFESALEAGERAVALATEHGYARNEARAYRLVGDALIGLGRVADADASYGLALEKFRSSHSETGELELLAARAALYYSASDFDGAERTVEAALSVAEELRAGIGSASLRSRFVATLQDLYMMQLDLVLGASPSQADVRTALQLNDRRRARVLREELALGLIAASKELDHEPARRYASLRANLAAKQTKLHESAGRGSLEDTAGFADEINRLRIELLALDAEIAASNEHWASVVQQPALDIAAVQSRLAEDAVVLDMAFSGRATHVWYVTDSAVAYRRYAAAEASQDSDALRGLLSQILGDVAAEFPHKSHLTVIPDGSVSAHRLAGVQFEGSEEYLVDQFDITLTPSIALVDMREAERQELERLTLVGEPIYMAHQTRSASLAESTNLTHTLRSFDIDTLAPLPYSGVEIDAVRKLAHEKQVSVLRGLGANKATVLSGALEDSDIVHFATHGFVNTQSPELSGIVLSLVDENNDPIDGFVSVQDIFGLREIDASIVVLSGCRTAAGERIRGEGPMSLARAFMQVGVRHTVASQWDVSDRATAELMIAFYDGLLRQGRSPANALAYAQRQIKVQQRWKDPFYWAGFTLWSASPE